MILVVYLSCNWCDTHSRIPINLLLNLIHSRLNLSALNCTTSSSKRWMVYLVSPIKRWWRSWASVKRHLNDLGKVWLHFFNEIFIYNNLFKLIIILIWVRILFCFTNIQLVHTHRAFLLNNKPLINAIVMKVVIAGLQYFDYLGVCYGIIANGTIVYLDLWCIYSHARHCSTRLLHRIIRWLLPAN